MSRPLHKRLGRAWSLAWDAMRDKNSPRRRDFAGAQINRLTTDWADRLRSIDEEIKKDGRLLRGRARSAARDQAYFRRFLRMQEVNVLGPAGMRLRANVTTEGGQSDTAANVEIERAWKAFKRTAVTVDGRLTLNAFERLALRTRSVDGDCFIRIVRGWERNPFRIGFQFIDADLLDDQFVRARSTGVNEVRLGVEIDEWGAPVGYWFWDRPASISVGSIGRKRYFVPAADIIHLYRHQRPNQTRGVTDAHATLFPARMLDAYEDAEVVAARLGASKMGFFESDEEDSDDTDDSGTPRAQQAPAEMDFAPGVARALPKGWKYNEAKPEHPSVAFPSFVKQMLRKIATGLNVFYNALANDAEGVTYSTWRGFKLVENDDWRMEQQEWMETFEDRIYPEWLRMALMAGRVRLPISGYERYLDVSWGPRGWDWVDPLKEMQAAALELDRGLTSHSSLLSLQGIEFEDVLRERKRDRELAAAFGESLSATPLADIVNPDAYDQPPSADGSASSNGNGSKSHASRLGMSLTGR